MPGICRVPCRCLHCSRRSRDWKILNNAFGGLPKAIVLGTIVCAFMNFLVAADFGKLRKALGYFPIFLLLIAVYSLISLYIWITDFSKM
ncbi:MAG: hypothetical protein IJM76_07605, partial [Lachnospiraceae bacterium]|nr:hypothetical protein [Lachnospiraceae bacterium]